MKKVQPVMTALRLRIAYAFLSCFIAAASLPAMAASVSTQFYLGGYVKPGTQSTFDLADLQAFAAANPTAQRTVSVPNSAGTGNDVYTGISLNSFLSYFIKTDTTVPKNDLLRGYVIATGTDGYKSVFSLAELNTAFGNQNDIIAYQLNSQNLTTNGFARIVVPGDVKAGRWVSNLASLEVGHVPYSAGPGGVTTRFTVGGQVGSPVSYDAASLPGTFSPSTVAVTTPPLTGTTFTGVSLWRLLNQSTIIADPNVKNDILGKYVIATGSDGYQAVFSLGELSPNFGNQQDLLAYANAPGSPLTSDGFARVVVPGDVAKAGRYVSNLIALEVVDAPNYVAVECLFNWAEKIYPALFSSAGTPTGAWNGYTYRYYSSTNTYLGVSSADNHVFYIGSDGKWQDEGLLSYWLPSAACQ